MPDLAYPLRWLWLHRRRSGWLYSAYIRWARTPSRQSLAAFYPALLAGRLEQAERVLVSVFQQRADHRTQREALVAKLLLRIAQGNRLLAARILRFMTLHYSPADRDGAVVALRPRLAGFVAGSATPSALRALAGYDGPAAWRAFEPRLAAIIAVLPDAAPESSNRHPTGAWPDGAPRVRSGRPATVVLAPSGGLGNQLFQYAAALGCARRSGVEPLIDLAAYESPEAKRSFYLSRLDLPFRVASRREIARAARCRHREMPSLPDRVVLEHRGDILLRGYWENPRYLAGLEAELRSRFRPRDAADAAAAAAFVTQARQGAALVGVHVRRGDRTPEGDSFHREILLSPTYYRRAAAEMPRGAGFAVFSDRPEDVAWCRAHLGLEDFGRVTYADGRDPIVDFFALSACDHQIISASTFSWWAAWLNPNPNKIVVAPPLQQGYGPRSAENDLDTRLPAEWRIIPDDPPNRCGAM